MEVHVEIGAETLFEIGPVAFTNSMLMMFLVMAAILIVFTIIARTAALVPGRPQGTVELIVEFMLDLVVGAAGKRAGRRMFPLVAGLFIFILFANFSGLLPGVGTIFLVDDEETHTTESAETQVADTDEGNAANAAVNDADEDAASTTGAEESTAAAEGEAEEQEAAETPLFRSPTADLNMTLAMSILAFIIVQIAGVSVHGVGGRIRHMADPPFIFPIEVISELSRIISLAARLFGNVFAGEVLLAVMYAMASAIKIALIPVLFPVVFMFLEVLFGAIQALVFALLTLIYIVLAVEGGHDEDEHETAPATGPTETAARGAAPAAGGD